MTFPVENYYRERQESLKHYYRGDYAELSQATEECELIVKEHAEAPHKTAEFYAELWVELATGKLFRIARTVYVKDFVEGSYSETTFYLPSREYPFELPATFTDCNEWWSKERWI